MRQSVGAAFFLTSLLLALGAAHLRGERPGVNYDGLQACIAHAERSHPLRDRHQELVNALYACGVYRVPATQTLLQEPPWLPRSAEKGT